MSLLMAQTLARAPVVTSSPESGGAHGGPVTAPPAREPQLTLGSRLSDEFEEESRRLLKALRGSLTADGRSLNDAAELLGIDDSLLTRQVQGNGANLSPRLLVFALWRDQTHTLARYLADLSGGEWKAKPAPSKAAYFDLLKEDLIRRGLWDLEAEAIGYRTPTAEE